MKVSTAISWEIGNYISFPTHFDPGFVLAFSGIISCKVSLDISFLLLVWKNEIFSLFLYPSSPNNMTFHDPQPCSGMGPNGVSVTPLLGGVATYARDYTVAVVSLNITVF